MSELTRLPFEDPAAMRRLQRAMGRENFNIVVAQQQAVIREQRESVNPLLFDSPPADSDSVSQVDIKPPDLTHLFRG